MTDSNLLIYKMDKINSFFLSEFQTNCLF